MFFEYGYGILENQNVCDCSSAQIQILNLEEHHINRNNIQK